MVLSMDRGRGDATRAYFPHLIARQDALARLVDSIRPPYRAAQATLIEGPAGIGKTSVLWAGLAQAEDLAVAILRASPLEAEVSYAYATLGDLLEPHLAALAGGLSHVHLTTLRLALGGSAAGDGSVDPGEPPNAQQVSIALLAALRVLVARRPTVIAIDDAAWVDQASSDALSYAIRRLADTPVRVVVTLRGDAPGQHAPLGLADPARPIAIERLWLEPLSMGALQSVLQAATGATFSRPTLIRIREISAGNPFYAIELARALAARGAVLRPGEDLPVPVSLRELVADRLNGQPAPARRLLLTAALSSGPTVALLEARAGRDPRPILRPAIDAGLFRMDGRRAAFTHPLFASTMVAEANDNELQSTHAWLGDAADEDVEARARHTALARPGIDAAVAEQLAQASARSLQRGAPTIAGELADLAVERTPAGDPERAERALAAADAWYVAGDFDAVRDRVAKLLPAVAGTQRARALLLAGLAAWYVSTSQDAVATLLLALADARGDRLLEGLIHYYLSIFHDYDLNAARRHALAAAELLADTADRGHEAAALLQAFFLTVVLGRRPPLSLFERGLKIETQGAMVDRLTSPGIWWAAIGRLDLARERFRHMLEFDLIHGVYSNVANLATRQAEVELWADDWPAARQFAVAAIDARLEIGGEPSEMSLRPMALLDALEGRLDQAEATAVAGIEGGERSGAPILVAAWLQVLTLVAVSRGDAQAVEEATGRAWRHLHQIGFREPLRLDPAPERVEALAALGRIDEADRELAELRKRHRRVPKPWAAAGIARGEARLALARDDVDGALLATDPVATGDPPGWSRFDVGRTLLARGEAMRRARSRRAAAEVLTRAESIFESLGAPVWAQRARDESARLGLTRSNSLALTPTEARVAQLAGEGLSTRAVAAELGISPRTVETHLAAAYGKLGVNSRAQLGRAMAHLEEE